MADHKRVQRGREEKYQGREIRAHIQAPTREGLEDLLKDLQGYAAENSLEQVEVLQFRPDPDSGWEATVQAHNWNPISWLKEKVGGAAEWVGEKFKGEPREEVLLEAPSKEEYQREYSEVKSEAERLAEQLKREQENRRRTEEELKKSKKKTKYGKKEAEFAWGWWEYARATIPDFEKLSPDEQRRRMEDLASRIPPEQAERISKTYRETAKASAESGVPYTRTEYVKTWVPGHYVDSSGKPVKEGTPGAEYKPGEYTFKQIPMKRSPAEIMAEAAILKGGIAEMEERVELAQQRKRERKLAPIRAVGEAIGRPIAAVGVAGIGLLGEGMGGIAMGSQRGLAPGRGGPQRAQRIHTPGIPSEELYRVRTPAIDLSGLRQGFQLGGLRGSVRPQVGPGLGHLREATLPSSTRRPTLTPKGTPPGPNLEKLRQKIREGYPKIPRA